jgi:hypothetical protein
MSRTKAYRRFVMQKVKKHAQHFIKQILHDTNLANDQSYIGKRASRKIMFL